MTAPSPAHGGPLAGLRILTMAHLYPGPWATMVLADLGADVVIVEGPDAPDRTRRYPGHFEALNRNKRAVAIDLKTDAGREALLGLVEHADALVEGFRPGVMARLGLAPQVLRARNPRLVVVSISGYGQTGPMAAHGAHDLSLQGLAGLLDTGDGGDVAVPPLVLADIAAANAAALGVVTALLQRERTGRAAHVDVSMLDSLVAWTAASLVPALNAQRPARLPPTDPGYGVFRCADGALLTLSISGEDHLWRSLCLAIGLDAFAQLAEEQRIARRDEVQRELRRAFAARPAADLVPLLEAAKVPFAPVHRPLDVPADPQVAARRLVVEHTGPGGDTLRYVRQPLVFDGVPTAVHRRAPALGEHDGELLGARRARP